MTKYIDADKLIVEIKRRIELLENGTGHPEVMKRVEGVLKGYNSLLSFIDSLQQEAEEEQRKRNDEMQKISIEYRDSVIKHIEAKRVLPSFRGQLLHDFKNELNTMKQILNIQMWPQNQYAIFEKVALAFAAWGGYHFHPKESLKKDERQKEQPEVDLEREIEKYCRIYYNCKYPDQIQNEKCSPVMPHIVEAARHFYELGLKERKEE